MSLQSASKLSYFLLVTLNADTADSLVLACFNICLAVSGFILQATSYAILCVAVFYCALPVGLLFTAGFSIRDVAKGRRRGVTIAVLLSLPLLIFEIWLMHSTRLDF